MRDQVLFGHPIRLNSDSRENFFHPSSRAKNSFDAVYWKQYKLSIRPRGRETAWRKHLPIESLNYLVVKVESATDKCHVLLSHEEWQMWYRESACTASTAENQWWLWATSLLKQSGNVESMFHASNQDRQRWGGSQWGTGFRWCPYSKLPDTGTESEHSPPWKGMTLYWDRPLERRVWQCSEHGRVHGQSMTRL